MASIEIRSFSAEYTQAVIDLILPIQRDEFSLPVTIEAQTDLLQIPSFYQKGSGNFWLAFVDEQVVGTIALVDIENQQAALRKMFVKASHRGSEFGIAKRLLDTLLTWSAQRQLSEIYLGTTDKFHAAHRFYEKCGFIGVPSEDLPSNFSAMAIDTKFYRYRLLSAK